MLFVGNSYTYVNALPILLEQLSDAAPTFDTEQVTQGGASLQDHVATTGAVATIQLGGWDAVVLQGQSVEPILAPAAFHQGAAALAAEASTVSAKVVFFETWARAAGHAVYDESWSGGTPAAMQAGLRAAYQKAADDSGAVMAAVGDAWETALARSSLTLHSGDGSHPTLAGSYLAASAMYLELTARSTIASPALAPAGLSESDASELRAIAELAAAR